VTEGGAMIDRIVPLAPMLSIYKAWRIIFEKTQYDGFEGK